MVSAVGVRVSYGGCSSRGVIHRLQEVAIGAVGAVALPRTEVTGRRFAAGCDQEWDRDRAEVPLGVRVFDGELGAVAWPNCSPTGQQHGPLLPTDEPPKKIRGEPALLPDVWVKGDLECCRIQSEGDLGTPGLPAAHSAGPGTPQRDLGHPARCPRSPDSVRTPPGQRSPKDAPPAGHDARRTMESGVAASRGWLRVGGLRIGESGRRTAPIHTHDPRLGDVVSAPAAPTRRAEGPDSRSAWGVLPSCTSREPRHQGLYPEGELRSLARPRHTDTSSRAGEPLKWRPD